MTLSPIGEAVLIAREGRRLQAYRDSAGIWTIGIGITSASGLIAVRPGLTITAAECDALAHRAFALYAGHVDAALAGTRVTQHGYDALVSVCFNIGPAAFGGSTFLKRLRTGDVDGAQAALLWWNRPAAILGRRQAEADQLLTPYALALPRPTRGQRPITVAAPVGDVLDPRVATPILTSVTRGRDGGLWRHIANWIDETWGQGTTDVRESEASSS